MWLAPLEGALKPQSLPAEPGGRKVSLQGSCGESTSSIETSRPNRHWSKRELWGEEKEWIG